MNYRVGLTYVSCAILKIHDILTKLYHNSADCVIYADLRVSGKCYTVIWLVQIPCIITPTRPSECSLTRTFESSSWGRPKYSYNLAHRRIDPPIRISWQHISINLSHCQCQFGALLSTLMFPVQRTCVRGNKYEVRGCGLKLIGRWMMTWCESTRTSMSVIFSLYLRCRLQ